MEGRGRGGVEKSRNRQKSKQNGKARKDECDDALAPIGRLGVTNPSYTHLNLPVDQHLHSA